jgi:hypothetical protein
MNRAAQALGRMAKGIPKTFSASDLDARKARLTAARAKRWAGHTKKVKTRETL